MFASGWDEKSRRPIPWRLKNTPRSRSEAILTGFRNSRETNRPRLPVGIGQHEVIQQVWEGLVLDGNRQVRAMDEIGGTQPPRMVLLAKKHLFARRFRRTTPGTVVTNSAGAIVNARRR